MFIWSQNFQVMAPIIWTPKYRRPILNIGLCGCLKKLFSKILKSLSGCELIEYNMAIIIPPKYSVSDVIGQIKSQSGSNLRKKFYKLTKLYQKESTVWLPGYFASTISINEKIVIKNVKLSSNKARIQVKRCLNCFKSSTDLFAGICL